jgi:hypothetical protein
MFEIKRYTAAYAEEWNEFVARSKNATFLFDRCYMDYHADRFCDYSLMFFKEGKLYAVMPANVRDGVLYSHQGLTYGGLLQDVSGNAADTMALFAALNDYLRENGIVRVVYKAIPWIYQQLPSEEDLYALTQVCRARLAVRELSTTIVLPRRLRWSRIRRRGVKRASEAGVTVEVSRDYASFWKVLDSNLHGKYGVHPVHTLAEITLLAERFPKNMVLYVAKREQVIMGGVLLYITPQVVHAQYSSATPEGKRMGVLDAIYHEVMLRDYTDYPYFDFGKSTEDEGHYLNEQLIFQKEGFGGRGLCYDTYEWEL